MRSILPLTPIHLPLALLKRTRSISKEVPQIITNFVSELFVQYYRVPGSDVVLPMMSLGDGHKSFSKHSRQNNEDPIATAIKKGKAPTLRDVKLSVKVILSMLSFPRSILITFG